MKLHRRHALLLGGAAPFLITCCQSHAAVAARRGSSAGNYLAIEAPISESEVERTAIIRGKVSDRQLRVYVLVRPLASSSGWWVQRAASPTGSDGSWRTLAYFGTENEGINEIFEIVAVAPTSSLSEGKLLEEVPAGLRSETLSVRRIR